MFNIGDIVLLKISGEKVQILGSVKSPAIGGDGERATSSHKPGGKEVFNMANCFVRDSWYVEPPAKGSDPEAWKDWLDKDRKAAIQAKRAFTKTQAHSEPPESMNGNTMRKVCGVWKSTTNIGFTGDEESGHLEPIVQPSQERDLACSKITPVPRGVSHKHNGTHNRKVRRDALKSANSRFAQLRRQGKLS